mgnify:CR=1 FL=1
MSLVVYKSSAGSGKTATLVIEYLKLCLPNPSEFKRTLAITFTNKAANEMKSRIISTLELGKSDESNFLIDILKEELNYNDQQIKKASKQLLSLIIHNYDEFAISTIDSFVHRIVRTFANEVNLPSNFEVILDEDEIVPEIVDELFDKVGSNKELTHILVSFVMKQIDEEKSHDLANVISDFVKYNLSEDIFTHKEYLRTLKLSDFPKIISQLAKNQKSLRTKIETEAKNAIKLFDSVSLTIDDISRKKSGAYAYFENLVTLKDDKKLTPNSYVLNAINEDAWLTKKASPDLHSAIDFIKNDLIEIFNNITALSSNYFLIKLINSKIYSVALSTEIQQMFEAFVLRTSKVHISEFNKRISDSIADQPIPFLYERLGFKYRHFLIDEFQDTSVLQWENLMPLVEESLANNNFNMLVGDAKQAIYRFRNGEVDIFTSLPKIHIKKPSQFNQSRQFLFESQFKEKFLNVNYRSNKHIVEFNNSFFSFLKRDEQQRFKDNYSNNEQKIHNSDSGYVKLQLIDAEGVDEYSVERLNIIEGFVSDTLNKGFKPGDICVLCRTRKQLAEVATKLIAKNYKIVSSESLLVSNSPKVGLIISFLRVLVNSNVSLKLAEFVYKYSNIYGVDDTEGLFDTLKNSNKNHRDGVLSFIKSDESTDNLMSYSVYEICEFAIRSFKLQKTSDAFLQYFLDFVYKSQSSGNYTINDFLIHWEDKKSKIFVQMPEDPNAIKLMTAHKSKGLDFKVVIADLSYTKRPSSKVFWTDINIDGLSNFKKTLLPLQKSISDIGMENIYNEEEEKDRLDFLNLVYVSFTRASSALFAVGHNHKRDVFGGLFSNFIDNQYVDKKDSMSFEIGELLYKPVTDDKENQVSNVLMKEFPSTNWQSLIQIAETEDIYWDEYDFSSPASFGKLVHEILSKIKYNTDVSKAISNYRTSGLINELEELQINKIILKLVNHPLLKNYYSDNCIVKNETELVDKNGKIVRPDRVVIKEGKIIIIDYKTGKKNKKHNEQIEDYAEVFYGLGYEDVLCILVYLGDEIEVETISYVR